MKNKKEKYIQIRISEQEKEEVRQEAHKKGFDTVTQYLLWLHRNFRGK